MAAVIVASLASIPAAQAEPAAPETASTDATGPLRLLTDPYLQSPTADGVTVSWATAFEGQRHVVLVGDEVGELTAEQALDVATGRDAGRQARVVEATSAKFSRLADNINWRRTSRDAWRHEAQVSGLAAGEREAYRIVSIAGSDWVVSGTFSLAPAPRPGDDLTVLLTSDHQAMANTPANLQKAAETLGDIDAVFMAGDLVNHPDAGRQWFEDGTSFFNAMQGNASRDAGGRTYQGAEILQNAPIYPAVGNHEVQGRIWGPNTYSMGDSFNSPTPRHVAETAYERDAARINPSGDPLVRETWIESHSWSTSTYEEMFTLPQNDRGDETYYATTVGDVRLISLFSTRIWRSPTAQPNPTTRENNAQRYSRFQERPGLINDEVGRNYGSFIFEDLAVGSAQHDWLKQELESEAFKNAPYRVVMMHEGPQGLGDNVDPPFTDPVETRETDAAGNLIGIRYEYPKDANILLNDVQPLLEDAGVDLVYNGHSHLWNRFESARGTDFLESSNVGNSYGVFDPLSGRSRPLPPEPWQASNYTAQGNPGGLAPIAPNIAPQRDQSGTTLPFLASNDHAVFSVLRTGTGEISSYSFDVRTPDVAPVLIDTFSIAQPAIDAPQVTSADDGATVEGKLAELAGTGEPGASIAITGAVDGQTQVDADGTWHIATDLGPGLYDFSITQREGRRTSSPTEIQIAVNPTAPSIEQPIDGARHTLDEAPRTITGSGLDGATVTVTINDRPVGVTVVTAGAWRVDIPEGMRIGVQQVAARQEANGQTSRTSQVSVNVVANPSTSPSAPPTTGPTRDLPTTGIDPTPMAIAAVLLLALGTALILAWRRRRARH